MVLAARRTRAAIALWFRRTRHVLAQGVALALLIGGVADVASTNLALSTNLAVEANPLVAWVQAHAGAFWIVPKLAVHLGLALFVVFSPRPSVIALMGAVAALVFLAAGNNFAIYLEIQAALAA
ncbi:MAG: DUF5658 family protein [Pseudomonadota bacterium]